MTATSSLGFSATSSLEMSAGPITTIYTLSVAGIGEGSVDVLLPSFVKCRASGILWFMFLVIAQVLLLNLVIDTFVAAYINSSDEEREKTAEQAREKVSLDFFPGVALGGVFSVSVDCCACADTFFMRKCPSSQHAATP